MKKKKDKIPNFKSREEEANFWDTHSFADYWDDWKDVDVEIAFKLQKPKEEAVSFRLEKSTKDKLEKVAKSKGISVSSLARLWLTEKVYSNLL
ncbi:MAG: CopG family antitoxin [Candidatus Daviesbacteria bacterium]|nr:CopG family antitoxin [Candidatus Daviesbacteria bacterium]